MAEQGEAGGPVVKGDAGGGGGAAEAARGGGGGGGGGGRRRRGGRRPWTWRALRAAPPDSPAPTDHLPGDQHSPNKTYFYVKGYPAGTEVKEVESALAQLKARVVEQHPWGMLVYTEHAARLRRLRHMPPPALRGRPLRVYLRADPSPRKQLFSKSKQNSTVRDPRSITSWGSSFGEQVHCVLAAVRLSAERVQRLHLLYEHVEEALRTVWPECEVEPFGSIMAGVGMASSDADCFVHVPRRFYRADGLLVNQAERALRKRPQYFTELLTITGASTPIVKLFHLPTDFNCDLSFKSPLGVQNSKLIGTLLQVNSALAPCVVVLKYWARVRGLSGPGRLSNYALTLMFVFYLQVQTGLLPSVESLQSDPDVEMEVSGWNAGFSQPEQLTTDMPFHQLFAGFFTFYASFDFEAMAICPLLGRVVEKSAFGEVERVPGAAEGGALARYVRHLAANPKAPLKHDRPVLVQDPFDHSHNVASAVSKNVLANLLENFAFVAGAYEETRDDDAKDFLKKILLEGPPQPKVKKASAPVSVMYERVGWSLSEAEWRAAMETATCTALGRMLGLPLLDDAGQTRRARAHPHGRVQLAWHSALHAPVWRRKRYQHLYRNMDYDYIDMQERITDQIIAANREEMFVRVGVTLRLKGPGAARRAKLTVRYLDGELDTYVELKNFIERRLNVWMRHVLRIQVKVADLPELYAEAEALAMGPQSSSEDDTSEDSDSETAPVDNW